MGRQKFYDPPDRGFEREIKKRLEYWAKLRAELPTHMRAMADFAIATGLRQSNVLNLRWDHVDIKRKVVWVEAINAKGKNAIGVPLSVEAINVLNSVQGTHPEFVFTYNGRPVSEIKTAWASANIRAGTGCMVAGKYRGFTWHGMRHTWATWHVQNGTPLDVLQKLGGWASYSMVLRYAHHAPGYLAGFADNTTKDKMGKIQEDSQRPTEIELEQRIVYTMTLIASHLHKSQIKANIRAFVDKQTGGRYGRRGTQLTARTIESYIARAYERWRQQMDEEVKQQQLLSVAYYSQTIANPKNRTADKIRARENLDRIFGIGQPSKIDHHVTAEVKTDINETALSALRIVYGTELKKASGVT